MTRILKDAVERRDKDVRFAGILGNSSGTVLTSVAGKVYVTKYNGETITVLNRRVPNTPYLPVVVGYDASAPGVLQVLYARDVYGTQDTSPAVPDHAETHRYAGGDTDFVEASRLMPFLVLPYSTFTVQVYGGVFERSDGAWGLLSNQTVDLSSYQPSAGAEWVLLQYDDDGVISVLESSEVDTPALLTVSSIPSATQNPLAAIKLYEGQTEIQRNPNGINDFADPRFGWAQGGGGTGTGVIQRNLAQDLTMVDGTCLILKSYLNIGVYDLNLEGDADLVIL